MRVPPTCRYGPLLLALEGICLIISTFLPWTGNYSIYELYLVGGVSQNRILYLFPLITGIILLIEAGMFWLWRDASRGSRILLMLGVLLAFNLELFFFTEIFATHGQYIWQYSGLYVNLVGLGGLLLTLLYCLSGQTLYPTEDRD